MKEKKAFWGLLVVSLLIASVTVYAAANRKVEAWLTDDIELVIGDSGALELPDDVHIINYDGRIYLPMRYVAEQMGGTVIYVDELKRVVVETPAPVVKTVEVPAPTQTPSVEEEQVRETAKPQYNRYPVRVRHNDLTINVSDIERPKDRTYIYVDVYNNHSRFVSVDFQKAYIEIDGKQYETIYDDNYGWGDSISSGEERLDQLLVFQEIPEDATQMKIVVPVIVDVYDASAGMVEKNYDFTFYVEFD